jgi:flagellar biosynthesis protein FlhF
MKIIKLRASTKEELEEKIAEEYGSEAILLTTREIEDKSALGLFNKKIVEGTVAIEKDNTIQSPVQESEDHLETNLKKLQKQLSSKSLLSENNEEKVSISRQARIKSANTFKDIEEMSYTPSGKKKERTIKNRNKGVSAQDLGNSLKDLRDLSKRLVSDFKETAPTVVEDDNSYEVKGEDDDSKELKFLVEKGVSNSIVKQIERNLQKEYGEFDSKGSSDHKLKRFKALHKELSSFVSCHPGIELTLGTPTSVALIGPTGTGKTTTSLKCAIYYAKLGKSVALLQLNTKNAFLTSDISSVLEPFSIPVFQTESSHEALRKMEEWSHKDLIVVDIEGKNPCNTEDVEDLEYMLRLLTPTLTLLTLSSTMKESDLYLNIERFKPLKSKGVIFTKLDETVSLGSIVNANYKMKIPICYFTEGRDLNSKLFQATPSLLAKKLLIEKNYVELQSARSLASVS